MKQLFLSMIALVLVGFATHSQAQNDQQPAPVKGRFYCNGIWEFNLRMDADFYGTTAQVRIRDTKTGKSSTNRGYYDNFMSNTFRTYYRLNNGDISFPTNYAKMGWFDLEYRGWNGQRIRFDCNHF